MRHVSAGHGGAVAEEPMVSGAVCAGWNPAGGVGDDIFFEFILTKLLPVGELGQDNVSRPSTRRFVARPTERLQSQVSPGCSRETCERADTLRRAVVGLPS